MIGQQSGVIEALFVGGPWHGQIREIPPGVNNVFRHATYIPPAMFFNYSYNENTPIDPQMTIYSKAVFVFGGMRHIAFTCIDTQSRSDWLPYLAEAIAIAGRCPGEPAWLKEMIHDMEETA